MGFPDASPIDADGLWRDESLIRIAEAWWRRKLNRPATRVVRRPTPQQVDARLRQLHAESPQLAALIGRVVRAPAASVQNETEERRRGSTDLGTLPPYR